MRTDLTAEYVRSLLAYDPVDGTLFWKERPGNPRFNSRWAGKPAGCIRHEKNIDYLQISINGRSFMAHRLVWLIVTGEWPDDEIDHEDCDGLNNRWKNLREATRSKNRLNSRSIQRTVVGLKGVDWRPKRGKFCARIMVDGKRVHLGYFDEAPDAHAAYVEAAKQRAGEFARAA